MSTRSSGTPEGSPPLVDNVGESESEMLMMSAGRPKLCRARMIVFGKSISEVGVLAFLNMLSMCRTFGRSTSGLAESFVPDGGRTGSVVEAGSMLHRCTLSRRDRSANSFAFECNLACEMRSASRDANKRICLL